MRDARAGSSEPRSARVRLLLAAAILLCGAGSAQADLVGQPPLPPQLTSAETALVESHPALQPLVTKAPWLLRTVLNAIAQARRGGMSSADMNALDGDDAALLTQNPALREMWRGSPEAAAELLALIRAAAGSGGQPAK